MIKIWIFGMSFLTIWVYVDAVKWPTCSEITNAQTIFNMRGGDDQTLFEPRCTATSTESYTSYSCSKSCCKADMEGKQLRGIMAAPYQAIRYYVDTFPDPVGIFPVPFFTFDRYADAFVLAPWQPQNGDGFKFEVHYYYDIAFFVYAGNILEGTDRLFIPFLPPTWRYFIYWEPQNFDQELMSHGFFTHATVSSCSCGYYQAIEIQKDIECDIYRDYECYDDYKGEFKCLDIDECEEGIDSCNLVPHSHCVNTPGSYQCACDSGYFASGPSCIDISYLIISVTIPTSTSARIRIESHDLPKPSWSYSFNVTDTSNPTYPLQVYQATQVKVSQEMAKTGVYISDLNPGTNYSIKWDVLDENYTVVTDVYHFSSDTRFTTLCTCGRQTDAPILLGNETITQENGYIYFKFLGNSMCGNAYTFARQSFGPSGTLSKHTVFTPNYFFTGGECSPVPYEPGKSASDVLANSKLIVGEKYRYSIRAVGNKYLGDSSFIDFVIRWESSISGFVGLKPTYGELPVEGVVIRWALKDENGKTVLDGQTMTTKSGRFTIHPNALIPFDNDRDYPMHLSFSKVTEIDQTHIINHEFLCNNGRVSCTNTDVVVHLKHLDFDKPVSVIDTTSVPVSGRVYVANTRNNPDGTAWGGDGCPLANAKVCLIDRSPAGFHNELTCSETTGDGTYTLAGVIGSRVSINVTFNNHTFEYVPRAGFPDFQDGIEIQPQHIYEHNDFMDTTTVPLELTIAGGACDFFLGAAVVLYKINGCLWGGGVLNQPALRFHYPRIPAQNLNVEVGSIDQRPDINMPGQNLDLRLVPSKQTSLASADPESNNHSTTALRFEYTGIAKLRVQFQEDKNKHCTSMSPDIKSLKANSIHVLPFQRPMVAMIFIERDLGGGLICDAVDISSQVLIQNNLGLLADDPSDDDYAAAIASSMPSETLELLYHCNKGCLANVTHDYDPILKRNARAKIAFQFMTGRPNNVEPFVRQLVLRTVETNSIGYVAAVVITGQYKKGDLYSVGLPTYEPILIIRDPPGGTSSAFYENVQTTLRMESLKQTEYLGAESSAKLLAGAKADTGSCEGLGFEVCQTVIKVKDLVGYHHTSMEYDLTKLNYTVYSGGFTTTWSYKTPSSNPLFAGNVSDTYVIPNLNLKFSIIDTVSWNESTCTASSNEETAFNLESPENVPALAFVTGFEIVNTEIPSLELNINILQDNIQNTQDAIKRTQLENELKSLQDALQGWQDALILNEELKLKVIQGNATQKIKPHEWFDKMASKTFAEDAYAINITGISHTSGLLSEDLTSNAKLRPKYRNAKPSSKDLESANTIKFSGGGNEFVFQLSKSKMNQHVSDLGGSTKASYSDGADIATDNTFTLFNVVGEFGLGDREEDTQENLRTDEQSTSTNIGFTLSDPDAGDQFDVDVFVDPVFGTFIFHTRSGKSVCKHEAGTENRQLVKLEIISIPPKIVLENEPIVFHYRITKLGIGSLGYTLSLDLRDDSDALRYFPVLPREYSVIESGQSVIGTSTITRGPEKYEYPAVTLLLQPTCEFRNLPLLGIEATLAKVELYNYIDPVDQSKKIVFARSCASVVLQGEIAKDQKFTITSTNPDAAVKVVVQNPDTTVTTWADAVHDPDTRLKRVQLYYRPVGATQWLVGQHIENEIMVDIDFALAGREDAYGFATIGWEVSNLPDGNYEMQVRTVCDDLNNAPAIFNGQETEIIQGVIDRKPPRLYGLPQPQVELQIGQPITLTFDESLDCSLPLKFGVELKLEGVERVFDNKDLLLICEKRLIYVQFDVGNTNMEDLVGKHLNMTVTGIMDANRNSMMEPVSYSVGIAGNDAVSSRRQLDVTSMKEEVEELRREIKQIRQDMANLVVDIKDSLHDYFERTPVSYR